MSKYFKKPNGVIIEVTPSHDIDSLKERFKECDANGKELKTEKPKAKESSKNKGDK